MFSYAVKHHAKKADMEVLNNQNLTPLTLASKLGRHDIFKEIIELQSMVGGLFYIFDCDLLVFDTNLTHSAIHNIFSSFT